MDFQVRSPRNPLEWVLSVLVIAVVMAVGVMVAGLSIIVIGVFILISPILNWWRRRKSPPFVPGGTPTQSDPSGRVIDVEYEISEDD
jgi:hypothetical protein